jgi:hypothetical protein
VTKKRIRIAHLAGPNATIQNTPPLVTSNKARAARGLPLRTDEQTTFRHTANQYVLPSFGSAASAIPTA